MSAARSLGWPLRALLAGLLVAGIEVGGALSSRTWALFLGSTERIAFSQLALWAGLGAALLAYGLGELLARYVPQPDARARLLGVLVYAVAAIVLYLLTEGRTVRASPLRVPAVSLLALVPSVVVMRLGPPVVARAASGGSGAGAGLCVLLAVGAAQADARLLHRLYPVFHLSLGVLVVLFAALATWLAPLPSLERRLGGQRTRQLEQMLVALLALVSLVALPVALMHTLRASNLSFVVTEYAGFTGRVVQLAQRVQGVAGDPAQPPGDSPAEAGSTAEPVEVDLREGLRLQSRNVLLITVDALRADRVGSATGLTPELDALAAESAVFRRAYTPTPHTSYALSSLLTGKYLRPVLDLPGGVGAAAHVALPELLRRYGMRTAAFYPPAIFFVDAHRFEALRESHFGFEYRKEMFAPAHERVPQLREYLDSVDAEAGDAGGPSGPREVFAWVHLFEPHEPYDPDPRFARGDGAEARYDAEVAAADHAIGELVRVFREYRPGATVIVTADHGEEFGDHGGLYHGSTLYEEQVRVPLIWSTPGLVEPFVSDAPVDLVDIATTVLAALAIPRDARMRGDDLGPLLLHHAGGPRHAFSEVGDARMVTDGQHKAICDTDSTHCLLYDLVADPGEARNLASADPQTLRRLRAELSRFVASIPRVEALALEGSEGWPEALARAELGDVAVAPALLPLLGDGRPAVRAAAARLLGRLRFSPALATLARVRDQDTDAAVQDEAALSTLALGDSGSVVRVRALATREAAPLALRRRAAMALAERGDASQVALLDGWAGDATAEEGERRRAVLALGRLRARGSLDTLVSLLNDVRLCAAAATALGAIGDRRAVAPLRRRLRDERYVPARAAEAAALVQLGDRGVRPLILRFLGMEQPLPGGVELLYRSGALVRATGRGVVLADSPRALGGAWACDAEGCTPGEDASLLLPAPGAPRGDVRVVCAVRSAGAGSVTVAGAPRPLLDGDGQVAFDALGPLRQLVFSSTPAVRVRACVVVPAQEELPPPAPEPYEPDGDEDAGAASDAGEPGPQGRSEPSAASSAASR